MPAPSHLISLPGGLQILVDGKLGDFRLEGYRPVEARVGYKFTNGPLVKASEALAARRFATMVDLVAALQRELAK